MNGTQRVKALLNNERADRILTATWMHVPAVDRNPQKFAKKIIELTERYDSDIVKIQQNANYVLEAYGQDIKFFENPPLKYQKVKKLFEVNNYLIKDIEDLRNLKTLKAAENPVILREAESVRLIAGYFNGERPVLPTLFSSFSYLTSLTEGGKEKVREFIAEDREAVHRALEILNDFNKQVVDEFVKAGADGFFFATSFTSPLAVSVEEYEEFNRKYDLELLEYIHTKTWFNMLHVHGNADLYIDRLVDYPVESINWENNTWGIEPDRLTTAAKLRSLTDKILVGGNDQFHDFYGTEDEVKAHFEKNLKVLLDEVPDRKFIFGAGCSLPLDIKPESIKLITEVAAELS